MLSGGSGDLKPGEEHLVPVLPQDEGPDATDQRLGHVQDDLEQEVERERPADHVTAAGALVDEGACYRVISVQGAHAVLVHLLAAEATGLWVVVSSERYNQHGNDQADDTQDKVEELWRAEDENEVVHLTLKA